MTKMVSYNRCPGKNAALLIPTHVHITIIKIREIVFLLTNECSITYVELYAVT